MKLGPINRRWWLQMMMTSYFSSLIRVRTYVNNPATTDAMAAIIRSFLVVDCWPSCIDFRADKHPLEKYVFFESSSILTSRFFLFAYRISPSPFTMILLNGRISFCISFKFSTCSKVIWSKLSRFEMMLAFELFTQESGLFVS